MADYVTFKIAKNNCDDVIKATKERIEAALKACGTQAEGHAKANITTQGAVDTGNLRNSITSRMLGENVVAIGTNVEYAPYVELGTGIYATKGGRKTPWVYKDEKGEWHRTVGMKPRPFLKPAMEDNVSEYKAIIEKVLSK